MRSAACNWRRPGLRQLYSDLSETIIDVQRAEIILNGIAELYSLPTLDPEKRREVGLHSNSSLLNQNSFWCFARSRERPWRNLPYVKLARKQDGQFRSIRILVERALGWPRDTFTRAYEANRSAANFSAVEASPVASAVQAFVAEERVFEGAATEAEQAIPICRRASAAVA